MLGFKTLGMGFLEGLEFLRPGTPNPKPGGVLGCGAVSCFTLAPDIRSSEMVLQKPGLNVQTLNP